VVVLVVYRLCQKVCLCLTYIALLTSPLLSCLVMQDDFDKFYGAGADLVLQKPLKNDRLREVLACFTVCPNAGGGQGEGGAAGLLSREALCHLRPAADVGKSIGFGAGELLVTGTGVSS
jgi:hypothetical protein